MGAERDNGFSGEIISLEEREHRHGHRAVPVGIAQENHVVGVHVPHMGGKLRPGIGPLFLLRNIGGLMVIFGVGIHCFDPETVTARCFLDHPCNHFRVAHRQIGDRAADIVLAPTGKISHKAFCILGSHLFSPFRVWFVAGQSPALFIIRSFLYELVLIGAVAGPGSRILLQQSVDLLLVLRGHSHLHTAGVIFRVLDPLSAGDYMFTLRHLVQRRITK